MSDLFDKEVRDYRIIKPIGNKQIFNSTFDYCLKVKHFLAFI
jgi:hypothetical protein